MNVFVVVVQVCASVANFLYSKLTGEFSKDSSLCCVVLVFEVIKKNFLVDYI